IRSATHSGRRHLVPSLQKHSIAAHGKTLQCIDSGSAAPNVAKSDSCGSNSSQHLLFWCPRENSWPAWNATFGGSRLGPKITRCDFSNHVPWKFISWIVFNDIAVNPKWVGGLPGI